MEYRLLICSGSADKCVVDTTITEFAWNRVSAVVRTFMHVIQRVLRGKAHVPISVVFVILAC